MKRKKTMPQVDYNEISKVYDDVREGDIILVNRFLEELPGSQHLNVLDIGCGTGNYTDLLQKVTRTRGWQIYGIDPSEGMIKKARRKNRDIIFQQGRAEDLLWSRDFFDFIYMTDVIHHIPDIHRIFREINRVLKNGGKVCIVTQSHRQIGARPIAQFFPGTVRVDRERYPNLHEIHAAAQEGGLLFLKQEVLFEGETIELDEEYLELVQKKGYSMLHLIPEQEYRAGLEDLEKALQKGPIQARSAGETMIWFTK
jgi:ubiquinone/menaquinone biosynthesis C-methylase UbiE